MAISDKPWSDVSAADYPSAEAYCGACLINGNSGPASRWAKGECKLPVREPGGALNRGGVHAAAAALVGARDGVQASPAQRRSAAQKLVRLYAELDEIPPESLTRLARA